MTSELDGLGVRPDSTAVSGNTADTLLHLNWLTQTRCSLCSDSAGRAALFRWHADAFPTSGYQLARIAAPTQSEWRASRRCACFPFFFESVDWVWYRNGPWQDSSDRGATELPACEWRRGWRRASLGDRSRVHIRPMAAVFRALVPFTE